MAIFFFGLVTRDITLVAGEVRPSKGRACIDSRQGIKRRKGASGRESSGLIILKVAYYSTAKREQVVIIMVYPKYNQSGRQEDRKVVDKGWASEEETV